MSPRVPKPILRIRYDWKALSTDPGLKATRRRLRVASSSWTKEQSLAANTGNSLEKTRSFLQSKHPEVILARGKVEEARLSFAREPTVERRGRLDEAKQLLFSTYDKIKGEELMERVQRVQAAHGESTLDLSSSGRGPWMLKMA